jgi:hypothetical protein
MNIEINIKTDLNVKVVGFSVSNNSFFNCSCYVSSRVRITSDELENVEIHGCGLF